MRQTGAQRPGTGVRAGCPLPWPASPPAAGASPPAAGARPPGRTRPSAARTVNVETPAAAAICLAASSPAIRAASAGVSFDAPLRPAADGDQPGHPAAGQRLVPPPDGGRPPRTPPPPGPAARPAAAPAAPRPADGPPRPPASQGEGGQPVHRDQPAVLAGQHAHPRGDPGRPGRQQRERNLVEHTSHHPPSRQAGYLAGISSQTGREGRERHAVNADQPTRITRPMISMIWMKAGAPSWKVILRPRWYGYRVCTAGRPCLPLTAGLRG